MDYQNSKYENIVSQKALWPLEEDNFEVSSRTNPYQNDKKSL